MWPLIMTVLKRYSAVIVFPIAVIVGTIGYNIERSIRGKEEIVSRQSIQKERQQRLLNDVSNNADAASLQDTKKQLFHSVLDTNVKLSS